MAVSQKLKERLQWALSTTEEVNEMVNTLNTVGGVTSLNTLTGDLSIAAGSNITVTPSGGNTLTIASTGGSSAFSFDFGPGTDGNAVLDGTNTFSWAQNLTVFTITAATAYPGDTYSTPNGASFLVVSAVGTTLTTTGPMAPNAGPNTLTLSSGNGAATISYSTFTTSKSSYFITRPVLLNNLTINSGIILYPCGCSIYCKGTLLNNGTIQGNGNIAQAGGVTGGLTAGSGGAFANSYFINVNFEAVSPFVPPNLGVSNYVGQTGSTGTSGAGSVGTGPGTAPIAPLFSATATASGAGGNGTGHLGGAAGTTVYPAATTIFQYVTEPKWTGSGAAGAVLVGSGISGGGGASGGGDGTNVGGGGGGGGSCGSLIGLWASVLNNAGTIQSNGGAGGAGESPTVGNVGGGGGGAGGSGGFIYIISGTTPSVGTIQVNGGAGGAAGTGHGTGTNGTAGSAGSTGTIQHFQTSTATWI